MRASEDCSVLAETTADGLQFRVTRDPFGEGTCVLWFRDRASGGVFEALGRFPAGDGRRVRDLASTCTRTREIRREIDKRRFQKRIEKMTPAFFQSVARGIAGSRASACRKLFGVGTGFLRADLDMRRKLFAQRHHPDAGGDTEVMSLVNAAYDYLVARAKG